MTTSKAQRLEEPAQGGAAAFGAALKARRNQTGRSLEVVAQRVGLSTSTLSRYERGECLPSDKHLDTLCDALGISSLERQHLMGELQQVRVSSSTTRPTTSPVRKRRAGVLQVIGRRWRTALHVIVIAFALIGVAATIEYLIPGGPGDSGPGQAGLNTAPDAAGCDRYTVGAETLALRDFFSGPISQLQRAAMVTVIQRTHPRGLPYWEVTTTTNQEGWVDPRYLRPACG
ncbi:MAG TPA: helix-turn-helix transcriptional regulator [Pseudonocardiaceae bacterium]|nr:helix-turn-helix transcriptional regulator [Pseudonocardiaceae bacterium]